MLPTTACTADGLCALYEECSQHFLPFSFVKGNLISIWDMMTTLVLLTGVTMAHALRVRCPSPRCVANTAANGVHSEVAEWVVARGGSADRVAVGPTQFGLGLLATADLAAGEAAVVVPRACLLSESSMPPTPALKALIEAAPSEFWSARLGLMLLAERAKGDESALSAYLRSLPMLFTVPLFWTPAAVELIKYPTLQAKLRTRAKFVSSFASERLEGGCHALGGVGADSAALGWAVAACSSRAFLIGGERACVPLIDLGNHAPAGAANCAVQGGKLSGSVELVTQRPIRAGEELTFCYGERLTNDDFLLDYGFLPSENPHDTTALGPAPFPHPATHALGRRCSV